MTPPTRLSDEEIRTEIERCVVIQGSHRILALYRELLALRARVKELEKENERRSRAFNIALNTLYWVEANHTTFATARVEMAISEIFKIMEEK